MIDLDPNWVKIDRDRIIYALILRWNYCFIRFELNQIRIRANVFSSLLNAHYFSISIGTKSISISNEKFIYLVYCDRNPCLVRIWSQIQFELE